MAKRILLVDDEPLIIKGLKYTLEQKFRDRSRADGEEALARFFAGNFDFLFWIDALPKRTDTVASASARHNVPIFMLTAKGEHIDIFRLEYGADDYMTSRSIFWRSRARNQDHPAARRRRAAAGTKRSSACTIGDQLRQPSP
jgi:DNA-binding response OmpR family regulator